MSTPRKLEEAKNLDTDINNNNTSVTDSPKPQGKILQDDTPLIKFNKLLEFINENLKVDNSQNNEKGNESNVVIEGKISKCQEAVKEMQDILAKHVDGKLNFNTDNIFPQENAMDEARSFCSNSLN